MAGKTLLSVMLPATQKNYDFWVPSTSTVRDACLFISNILASREPDRFVAPGAYALMNKETGDILNPNSTIDGSGLVSGSQLVLV